MTAGILIVDDDAEVSRMIASTLEDEGYRPFCANNQSGAMELLRNENISVVFLDLWLYSDECAGLKILSVIRELKPEVPIIMISGHGNIENAVLAIKKGAYDFIEKPFRLNRLLFVTERAVELFNLRSSKNNKEEDDAPYLIGVSSAIEDVRNIIARAASGNSRIFVKANLGLGAELIVRSIHEQSARKHKKFVRIDCGIEPVGLEVLLFGEKVNGRYLNGIFDDESTGTLFLENISSMPLKYQRELQKYVQNIGLYHDVRIISSTSIMDFNALIERGEFLEDLYYRLNVVSLYIPPIIERKEDIGSIVDYFLANSESLFGTERKPLSENALLLLRAYDWPGNVRQIRNIVEYLLIMSKDFEEISEDCIPDEIKYRKNSDLINLVKLAEVPIREARSMFERYYLEMQLARFSGHISKVSKFIGMERSALHRKMRSLGLKGQEDF